MHSLQSHSIWERGLLIIWFFMVQILFWQVYWRLVFPWSCGIQRGVICEPINISVQFKCKATGAVLMGLCNLFTCASSYYTRNEKSKPLSPTKKVSPNII